MCNNKLQCHTIMMVCYVATLALGLWPRQKGLQGCEPRGSLGVTSHTPGSVRKCEGVNLHTPKATPTLGDGVPMDSQNFRERFQGSYLYFKGWKVPIFLHSWLILNKYELSSIHCSTYLKVELCLPCNWKCMKFSHYLNLFAKKRRRYLLLHQLTYLQWLYLIWLISLRFYCYWEWQKNWGSI